MCSCGYTIAVSLIRLSSNLIPKPPMHPHFQICALIKIHVWIEYKSGDRPMCEVSTVLIPYSAKFPKRIISRFGHTEHFTEIHFVD